VGAAFRSTLRLDRYRVACDRLIQCHAPRTRTRAGVLTHTHTCSITTTSRRETGKKRKATNEPVVVVDGLVKAARIGAVRLPSHLHRVRHGHGRRARVACLSIRGRAEFLFAIVCKVNLALEQSQLRICWPCTTQPLSTPYVSWLLHTTSTTHTWASTLHGPSHTACIMLWARPASCDRSIIRGTA
jgi:hypothetical protein